MPPKGTTNHGFALPVALKGLSQKQKIKVMALLPADPTHRGGHLEGWSIYREPTTINPPTTLRLHKRNDNGKLVQVVSITENGVTK